MAKTLMVQGTASSVGKSILVAAFCRIFKQEGYRVAPFKAQNMALNSFVTPEGGEIGRAQAVQAEAAGVAPSVDMNPILLKPEGDNRSQLIVRGRVAGIVTADAYYRRTDDLLPTVADSLARLCATYDIVVIEGAGSPAEINLREREIVNMRVARLAQAPVVLVGDIDRGGVFAALVGTLALLEDDERRYVRGLIINKFRGDISLLQPGLDVLQKRTSRPVLGVVPYFKDIFIAQEDSVYLDERPQSRSAADLDIAIIRLSHVSNYDDFDPLEQEGCRVRYVENVSELGSPDAIIIPGTKTTMKDLRYIWSSGLAEAIVRRAKGGTPVVGICGGYQMLGRSIRDPGGVEVEEGVGEAIGLGLLDVVTTFGPQKSTTQVRGQVIADKGILAGTKGEVVTGYEIHMGQTVAGADSSILRLREVPDGQVDYLDGAMNAQGMVLGTYVHGLFHNQAFRQTVLNNLRRRRGLGERWGGIAADKERQYDKLADHVRRSLDMAAVRRIVAEGVPQA
ncbi:MAG: cobyric acid synthase [Chloroflexi bacterium]|nr:cobyric acid synthase [Chloroflexota bacterium]